MISMISRISRRYLEQVQLCPYSCRKWLLLCLSWHTRLRILFCQIILHVLSADGDKQKKRLVHTIKVIRVISNQRNNFGGLNDRVLRANRNYREAQNCEGQETNRCFVYKSVKLCVRVSCRVCRCMGSMMTSYCRSPKLFSFHSFAFCGYESTSLASSRLPASASY